MRVFLVLYMESEKKSPKNPKFSILCCKVAKKVECSAPLWSFNFLSKLMQAANCVPLCLDPFCRVAFLYMKVDYHMTKMIQIKQYTICSSNQL